MIQNKHFGSICAITLIALSVLAGPENSKVLTFQWNASPDTNVSGYILYRGSNINDPISTWIPMTNVVGRLTTNVVVEVAKQKAFFVMTAYANTTYNPTNYTFSESDPSNPVYVSTTQGGTNLSLKP